MTKKPVSDPFTLTPRVGRRRLDDDLHAQKDPVKGHVFTRKDDSLFG